ncbi:MAG: putative bifunctional diguanylate cyclase/phosphodiesterase, partial [Longimicrobiales bacterium]
GGDEFAVLVDDVHDAEDAVRIAERIQQSLADPFVARGQRLYVSASIGIALGGVGDSTEALLRDADTAMYRAKRQRTRYALFDEAMHRDAVFQLELENDIRHAIARQEFVTYYQPLVRLETGEIIGFEALVRWNHPQRGLLMPDVFVPLAEETGLISDIGRWVLDQSCALLQRWNEILPPGQPFTLSVNVSGKQFLDECFADEVIAVLRHRRVPHSALKLELTETAMMEDSAAAARVLDRLREHGVSVWIDDFGTGYSSLAYVQRLPVGSLKIAREFVTGLPGVGNEAALVRAIVSLASTLGMDTIAEGVETEAQRRALCDLGCHIGQGWLFAPALDADAATRMLQQPLVSVEN